MYVVQVYQYDTLRSPTYTRSLLIPLPLPPLPPSPLETFNGFGAKGGEGALHFHGKSVSLTHYLSWCTTDTLLLHYTA